MEVSFAQCNEILKTLPVGYYAGRRIGITLDEKAETSMYSLMEDSIIVSYPIIAHRMNQVSNTANLEEAVRSMLYHEVSHAIMTHPEHLPPNDPNNIFEDERIETVLKDYYIGTDFKKQLLELHGGKIPKAKDALHAFFNAVRFRCAPEDIQNEVQDIIRRYAKLNRSSDDYCEWSGYRSAIHALFKKIAKDFSEHPENYQPQDGGEGQQMSPDQLQQGEGDGKGQPNGTRENGHGNSGDDSEEGKQGEVFKGVPETESPLNKNEIRRMVGAAMSKRPQMSEAQSQQLNDFTKTAEMIIGNFNKKNHGGSGINAYSGVFNPRAVVRPDYRFFERSMTTQGNNKFGTCHLNLFIDSSGSMCRNQEIVNGILASLSEIERKNRNFTMDVSFINHTYHDCTSVRDRYYTATGGNTIPDDMKERFLKRQLPNTCNYNIVLFDGDAICNDYVSHTEAVKKFSAFDHKQTTLITDPDNQQYLGSGFKSAKVVVTQNYTSELIEHITKALMIAFG